MKILLAGYPHGYMRVLGSMLAEAGFETGEANSLAEAQSLIGNLKPDTVICCFPWLKGVGYMTVVSAFKEAWRGIDLIIIDRHIELHVAVDLIHAGVFSCLNYPFATGQLLSALTKLKERRASAPGGPFRPSDMDFVKGISSVAKNMYHLIDLVAPTNFNVLIYGETGTGKELVARHIAHKGSSDSPFIAVDCGCLSRELALSELFGHEKGSFTGALERKTGAFETANNGTLFLDEIGNLDYEVQGFLLRAIQERKIRRENCFRGISKTRGLP